MNRPPKIEPGMMFLDLDENQVIGIVQKIKNNWVLINWKDSTTSFTPISMVIDSILQKEWIILDHWCDELVKVKNERRIF